MTDPKTAGPRPPQPAQQQRPPGTTSAMVPRPDHGEEGHCRELVEQTVRQLGGLDILVNNAAYQMTHETLEEISAEE
ncbi:hypothetical protein [Inquilinus sp.]|uniref:hypothetical protein n=1 Tax=Inquilinus sp. TaxID=1932117 RepID=UPI0037844C7B